MSEATLWLMAKRNNKPTLFELEGKEVTPCPFCGSTDVHMDVDLPTRGAKGLMNMELHWVECQCGARGPERTCRRYAVKLWQERHP